MGKSPELRLLLDLVGQSKEMGFPVRSRDELEAELASWLAYDGERDEIQAALDAVGFDNLCRECGL